METCYINVSMHGNMWQTHVFVKTYKMNIYGINVCIHKSIQHGKHHKCMQKETEYRKNAHMFFPMRIVNKMNNE